jgi:adenylosuccinate synthase
MINKTVQVVIGLGFGDEGKGHIVNYLSSQKKSIVVRFSGGHQAGHMVRTKEGKQHIFSSFGSGSFNDAPTYISKYCCIYPNAIINEYEALIKLDLYPILYVDNLAMVTTPFDIAYNRAKETVISQHGSCGVGIGTTMQRNETPYKLYAQDLQFENIYQTKIDAIKQYYLRKATAEKIEDIYLDYLYQIDLNKFYKDIKSCCDKTIILCESDIFQLIHNSTIENIIFEGSQGILLDQSFGFFPYVTYANTTSKNALEIFNRNPISTIPEIFYVSRAYQTRHGIGPMINEGKRSELTDRILKNPNETNILHEWQGEFRKSILDLDLLQYALHSDENFSFHCLKTLVLTCRDQVGLSIPITTLGDNLVYKQDLKFMLNQKLTGYLESWGPFAEDIR